MTALLLDSETDALLAMAAALRRANFEVRVASSLPATFAEVDVVVANVALPGAPGAQLLQTIRERDVDLPVVFVTGWPEPGSESHEPLVSSVLAAARHRVYRRRRSIHPTGVKGSGSSG
jgi:response regulator RpfG family c-di-GMP phosphodiesterase